ncbi:DNA repair protein RecN (Recombination protein N) [Inquilinus ginsengisoli]|uniref:DNA repair protein RecN n=1 Tax=Inquilinus ginsengisoli TaxID=363840 RepID=A0ABU1JI48_9PROT|nr:DNA repair protein RecN (Recombination protein N) [Inquilinus ginsengisoli]
MVLIEQLSLGFAEGLSALTGETGAGKSILLDALGLALGGRSDAGLVRHGADTATVSADFQLDDGHPVKALLAEQDLPIDDMLVLRRSVGADGRSRAYVNDQPVSIGLLRQIGAGLVEVHGQFETQGLLDPKTHRAVLDTYAGAETLATACAAAWDLWRAAQRRQEEALAEAERAQTEEGFLRHSVEELESLGPEAGEEAQLAERRALLQHREKVMEGVATALSELSGDRGAERALVAAQRSLQRIADRAGGRLDPILDQIGRAADEAADAAAAIERFSADIDLDAGELERLEDRLYALRTLARKHGVEAEALPELRRQFAERLALVEDRAAVLARLATAAAEARAAYVGAAEALAKARRKAASRLDAAVAKELPPLKMERARFVTAIEALPEADWGPAGLDRVAFLVAANPGSPPGPIGKIASGGELARFMLAIKVVLVHHRGTPGALPSMIFDEVDAGIGGAVADAVGERLKRLGQQVQVLVVTHSPQVAARADHHWRVQKADRSGAVVTDVVPLAAEDRREEIARMLSGAKITAEARAAADSLLAARS